MRFAWVFAIWLGLAGVAAAQADPQIADCSRTEASGVRTLCAEALVPAPAASIWPLLSTSEGLRSWAAPVAAIDLRIGGIWEASYRSDARLGDPANIRNRVLSFLPERMLSIAVDSAPPGFPHADLVRTVWTVIELAPVSATQTRVRVSMTGYGAGDGYDALYAMFEQGNALTLSKLRERVVTGRPADWSEAPAMERHP
jgi:uncharacterized protein YndB with AHSA1/START domain